jgi:hypothetical protein
MDEHKTHSASKDSSSKTLKYCHTKLRFALTDRLEVSVIEEGNIVLIFVVLFSEGKTVESSTDACEEKMSIDDVQEA